LAEGTPSEELTVLGWEIDTRRGIVKLPHHKFHAWDAELQEIIAKNARPIDLKTLERIQGRDVNVAMIVHGASHFLHRFYQAIGRAKQHGRTRLTADERDDLHVKRQFLRQAANGVDINSLTIREPDHLGRSDAFEGGIGGFDLTSGRAWRLQFPHELIHRRSQNFLEFLACITQLILQIMEQPWQPGDCFLSIGDNMSALKWIRQSNFDESTDQFAHAGLARHTAMILMERRLVNFTQWLPGLDNVVADALSRQHDVNDTDLTNHLFHSYPTQMPRGFHIRALPDELTSWVLYWVRLQPGQTVSPPKLTLALNGIGNDGLSSSTTVNLEMTHSSRNSPATNDTSYSEPSHKRSENRPGRNLRRATITWLRNHVGMQSMVYVRPSAQQARETPASTWMANLHSFYDDSSGATKTTTHPKHTRKRSHST
jgi:hypothetical protein